MIKEFFKPNSGKIILTIVFGLAAYFFGLNWCAGSPTNSGFLAPAVCYVHYNSAMWGPLFILGDFSYDDMSARLSISRLILGIAYWYLAASVIVFLYNITKRKNL